MRHVADTAGRDPVNVLGELIEDSALCHGGTIGTVASAHVAEEVIDRLRSDPALAAAVLSAPPRVPSGASAATPVLVLVGSYAHEGDLIIGTVASVEEASAWVAKNGQTLRHGWFDDLELLAVGPVGSDTSMSVARWVPRRDDAGSSRGAGYIPVRMSPLNEQPAARG